MITVIGPTGWPWGLRPSFTATNAYKKMAKAYPPLDETLTNILSNADAYYSSRHDEFVFEAKQGNQLACSLNQTTTIQNLKDQALKAAMNVTMETNTRMTFLKITYSDGKSKSYNEGELTDMTTASGGGIAHTSIPYEIPAGSSITTEAHYTLLKHITGIEPLVVKRTLLGQYTLAVRKNSNVQNLKYDVQSFSFDELWEITTDRDGSKHVILNGPMFRGQGVGLSWSSQ